MRLSTVFICENTYLIICYKYVLLISQMIFTTYVPDAIVWLPKLLGCA